MITTKRQLSAVRLAMKYLTEFHQYPNLFDCVGKTIGIAFSPYGLGEMKHPSIACDTLMVFTKLNGVVISEDHTDILLTLLVDKTPIEGVCVAEQTERDWIIKEKLSDEIFFTEIFLSICIPREWNEETKQYRLEGFEKPYLAYAKTQFFVDGDLYEIEIEGVFTLV